MDGYRNDKISKLFKMKAMLHDKSAPKPLGFYTFRQLG